MITSTALGLFTLGPLAGGLLGVIVTPLVASWKPR